MDYWLHMGRTWATHIKNNNKNPRTIAKKLYNDAKSKKQFRQNYGYIYELAKVPKVINTSVKVAVNRSKFNMLGGTIL